MPERVTREERIVSLAIEKAREVGELLKEKQRHNVEPTQVNTRKVDEHLGEEVKLKKPKATNANIKQNKQDKHNGFGAGSTSSAGEEFKKGAMIFRDNQTKEIYERLKNELSPKVLDNFDYEIKRQYLLRDRGGKSGIIEADINNAKTLVSQRGYKREKMF